MGRSDTDDDDLLARAAAGDGDAYARFYRRHLPAIAGFLLRTGDRELTADLAAEVFAAALLAAPRYRPGGPPALAWLYGIAANKLRESRRRGRVEEEARRRLAWEPQVLDDEDLDAVERLAAAGDGGADGIGPLLAAVAALPSDQRDAIVARVLDEQEYAEIADRLSCSESVVRQRVSRGLRTLRTRIGEETA